MPNRVYSFEPVIGEDAKVLVLGTLPSVKSLEKNRYYGNPQNGFWRIVYGAFGRPDVDGDYEDRLRFAQGHKIALWDVLREADRAGSLDADIKGETANDIPGLLRQYPGIKRIVLAGGKAAKAFSANFPRLADEFGVEVVGVPSTSPIPGRHHKTPEEKMSAWKKALTVE